MSHHYTAAEGRAIRAHQRTAKVADRRPWTKTIDNPRLRESEKLARNQARAAHALADQRQNDLRIATELAKQHDAAARIAVDLASQSEVKGGGKSPTPSVGETGCQRSLFDGFRAFMLGSGEEARRVRRSLGTLFEELKDEEAGIISTPRCSITTRTPRHSIDEENVVERALYTFHTPETSFYPEEIIRPDQAHQTQQHISWNIPKRSKGPSTLSAALTVKTYKADKPFFSYY
ncbi:hypothetical protein PG993_009096 [Apiospora rasikravindrae]|uniref:Uncharacterized protein n=1 Tax=Apiospora rasikravindrae TaxID=990691 RepID=A0ABR1SJR4_9PEZI